MKGLKTISLVSITLALFSCNEGNYDMIKPNN